MEEVHCDRCGSRCDPEYDAEYVNGSWFCSRCVDAMETEEE